MIFILSVIAFLVIFSLLVLVHEFGHFIMAKRAGIRVEEFGMGLPPRMLTIKKSKGTVYSLNWIPFGGFVRMLGEDIKDKKALNNPKSFYKKSIWQRSKVIVAGVIMNFLLAIFLLTIGFSVGMEPFIVTQKDFDEAVLTGLIIKEDKVVISEVFKGGIADNAHFKKGDVILEINSQKIVDAEQVIRIQKGKGPFNYLIERDGRKLNLQAVPNKKGEIGIGIMSMEYKVNKIKLPLPKAFVFSVAETWRLSILTVKMFGKLVVDLVKKFTIPEGIAGPVGIAGMTPKFVRMGIVALMRFTAMLSIALGVINIMPIPALDGGRLLFVLFELFSGKKPNIKIETAVHNIGFLLLMILIIAVTWKDIIRLFG